jgi:hypothetical protein
MTFFESVAGKIETEQPEELGSRVTISGGEVVELDPPAASKFDPDEVYPF